MRRELSWQARTKLEEQRGCGEVSPPPSPSTPQEREASTALKEALEMPLREAAAIRQARELLVWLLYPARRLPPTRVIG